MRWIDATCLPALLGILGIFGARPALAADRVCSSLAVEVDADVRARWPDVPERVRHAFDARDDIDRCARVLLKSLDGTITAEVALPDGRSTSRDVSRPEDVLPTLEALLLVPRRQLSPSPPEPPPVHAATIEPVWFAAAPAAREPDAPMPALVSPRPSRVRFEIGLDLGGRVGDGQTGVGVGGLALLEAGGWLAGLAGRVDRFQQLAGGPTDTGDLDIASLGGRRVRFGSFALDLIGGPALAVHGSTSMAIQSGPNRATYQSSVGASPRLLLGARLNLRARSSLRPFVGVDGEGTPFRDSDAPSGAPRLPVWSMGLTVGAAVGTQ